MNTHGASMADSVPTKNLHMESEWLEIKTTVATIKVDAMDQSRSLEFPGSRQNLGALLDMHLLYIGNPACSC